MKILILSSGTGEGHNSAAYAVAEALDRAGAAHELVDPLTFRSQRTAKLVTASYNGIIKKTPAAFGLIYRAGALYSSTRLVSPVYYANARYAGALRDYIDANRFDAVVTTHLFAMEALTAMRRKFGAGVPCYGVLTDYTCIPFFHETRLDGYFIPHDDLRPELEAKGVDGARLHATGIPVSARFAAHRPRAEAREALGVAADAKMLLIMTGGAGCGNPFALCDALLRLGEPPETFLLVGHNAELQEKLSKKYGGCAWLHLVPFTREVPLYMNAADALISKPGGLSSTEAAVANIPLVHLLAFNGCETKNVEFFTAHGLSVRADREDEAILAAKRLLDDPDAAERMRQAQRREIHPDAADRIAEAVMRG